MVSTAATAIPATMPAVVLEITYPGICGCNVLAPQLGRDLSVCAGREIYENAWCKFA